MLIDTKTNDKRVEEIGMNPLREMQLENDILLDPTVVPLFMIVACGEDVTDEKDNE